MKSFVLGVENTEQITLTVINYERSASGEHYDDNWLSCEVQVRAGAFYGRYTANFLTFELTKLLENLDRLYRDLKGSVVFEAMESQLELKFSCDNLGHIHVSGIAMDEAGIGHTLHFSFNFDQTYLTKALEQLRQVVQEFPVRTLQFVQAETASRLGCMVTCTTPPFRAAVRLNSGVRPGQATIATDWTHSQTLGIRQPR